MFTRIVPALQIGTILTLPILMPFEGGVPPPTVCAFADNSSVILLDHVLEEKFEGYRHVRVIACGLYELLPDHCIRFCGACLLHDAVDGVKQRRVTMEYGGMSNGCAE